MTRTFLPIAAALISLALAPTLALAATPAPDAMHGHMDHAMNSHAMSGHAKTSHAMSGHTTTSHAMSGHAMASHAMSGHAMSGHMSDDHMKGGTHMGTPAP